MSSHQSPRAKSVTWLTPPEWIEALGPFDLDPCCPPNMPWPTATKMMTETEHCKTCRGRGEVAYGGPGVSECWDCDGLETPWEGRVWLNPPFGKEWPRWVEKLADHGNGIALIPARTETEAFQNLVWGRADAVCFTGPHRPHFHYEDGTRAPFNSGVPIVLVAFDGDWRLSRSPMNTHMLRRAGLGPVVIDWKLPPHRAGDSK